LYNEPAFSIVGSTGFEKKEERELHFVDIIETALHFKHKSEVIIELIRLL